MRRLTAAIALTCTVAACSTFNDMDNGLAAMKGQPVDNLIAVLGYPSGQTTVAGRNFVVWSTARTVSGTTPVSTYNPGSYGGYSTTYMPTSYNYNCTIKVEVDAQNRIVGYNYDGNIGGCQGYSKALKKVAR